jgi:hypothetical protein
MPNKKMVDAMEHMLVLKPIVEEYDLNMILN